VWLSKIALASMQIGDGVVGWTQAAGAALGAGLVVGVFWLKRRRREQPRERPPEREKLLRPAGYRLLPGPGSSHAEARYHDGNGLSNANSRSEGQVDQKFNLANRHPRHILTRCGRVMHPSRWKRDGLAMEKTWHEIRAQTVAASHLIRRQSKLSGRKAHVNRNTLRSAKMFAVRACSAQSTD
jgi:hypothetical protein